MPGKGCQTLPLFCGIFVVNSSLNRGFPMATTFFIPNNLNACKSTPIGFIKNLLIDYMSFN